MKIYLNLEQNGTIETIDELDSKDFKGARDFNKEIKRLKNEYRLAHNCYSGIYSSQRCTKDWNN